MLRAVIRFIKAVRGLAIQREVDPHNPPKEGTAILRHRGGKLYFYRYGSTDEPIPLKEAFRHDLEKVRRAK